MIFVDWLVFVASLNHSLLETLSVFILSIILSKCAFLVCLITLVVSLRICLNFDHAASVFVCLFSSTMATLSFTNHFHNFRIHPGNGAWFYSNSLFGNTSRR